MNPQIYEERKANIIEIESRPGGGREIEIVFSIGDQRSGEYMLKRREDRQEGLLYLLSSLSASEYMRQVRGTMTLNSRLLRYCFHLKLSVEYSAI